MTCPAAEAIPAESSDEIVRDAAGITMPALFPNATFTLRTGAEGSQVLLADVPGPVTVDVAAPAPLSVKVTLDPGPCVAMTRLESGVVARVEGVTVSVRSGKDEVASWKIGRTMLWAPGWQLLGVQTPSGPIAFGLDDDGVEALRTLVEVPELRAALTSAPDVAARLGTAAPGAAQEALRNANGGSGSADLAGARLLAGPGVKGATVWIDGVPLGKIGASAVAPVGGLVKIRWEGVAEGGAEAVIGPGVDLELRSDGTARVVKRPAGVVCARRAEQGEMVVCAGDVWFASHAFSMSANACAPDGSVTVTTGPRTRAFAAEWEREQYWGNPRLPSRTIHPGLPGDYTYAVDGERLSVTWTPGETRCAVMYSDHPAWDADVTGHALYPASEAYSSLFKGLPWLAPLGGAYGDNGTEGLVFEKRIAVVAPDTGATIAFGREGEWTKIHTSWGYDDPGYAQIFGDFAVGGGGISVDLRQAQLSIGNGETRIEGEGWFHGKLCDGSLATASGARFQDEYVPEEVPAAGPGPHVIRGMGLDRDNKRLWFLVEPAPAWPLTVPGLPRPEWAFDLTDQRQRLVVCPL